MDKRMLISAVLFAYLLAFPFIVIPNRQKAHQYQAEITKINQRIFELTESRVADQKFQKALLDAVKGGNPSSLSRIQKRAQTIGILDKLRAVTPVRIEISPEFHLIGYDLRLEGVTLKEAVLFLESLEKESDLFLDRFVLEKSRDGMSLSSRIRILSIQKVL